MRYFIALLLLIPSIAFAGQTMTLVCKDAGDINAVIDAHVNDGDPAAYALAKEKVGTGACGMGVVSHPDDPTQLAATYVRVRDNHLFIAMPLQNGMTAIMHVSKTNSKTGSSSADDEPVNPSKFI